MKKVFIDTETTGLNPGQILQLTYCVCDINDKGEEKVAYAKNFFFDVDYVEPSAQKVHGFSLEILKSLSNGQKFEDVYKEVANDLQGGLFIAHNVNFDKKFVDAEFNKLGGVVWYPHDFFCTMEYFKPIMNLKNKSGRIKKPRLEESMEFLQVKPDKVLDGAKRLFNCDDVNFHDARYDVAALVSCYYKARKLGYDL